MADLSQNPQPTQPQVSKTPPSNQPPTAPPPAGQSKPVESSFPPTEKAGKPIPPEQEKIKEELSELGISPKGGSKKTRVLLAVLGVLLLVATLPAAIYLVRQRQEIRKEAAAQYCGGCSGKALKDYCTGSKSSLCDVSNRSCHGDCLKAWGRCCNECAPGNTCDDGHFGPIQDCFCSDKECRNDSCRSSPPPTPPPGGGCDDGCCEAKSGEGIWEFKCKTRSEGGGSEGCSDDYICLSDEGRCDNSCNDGTTWHPGPKTLCFDGNACTGQQLDLCENQACDVGSGDLIDFIIQDCSQTNCGGETPTPTRGASPTPTPTPTPTPALESSCDSCLAYDEEWNPIPNPSAIVIGQTVYFATRGSTTHPQGITKARFRINGTADETWCPELQVVDDWCETTAEHNTKEFYIQYVVPSAGSYKVESMVYNPGLGWY